MTLTGDEAIYTLTPAHGTHSYKAVYGGATDYAGSLSAIVSLTVN